MRLEMIRGVSNVIRFPIERRAAPTLELLRQIAPDPREVLRIIEAFDLNPAVHALRPDADHAMADRIVDDALDKPAPDRRVRLRDLLTPLLRRAIELCHRGHLALDAAATAHHRLATAQAEGGYWLPPLETRANALTEAAARLMVDAYVASEEAEGAARAIDRTLQGQMWQPANLKADAETLFFGGEERSHA